MEAGNTKSHYGVCAQEEGESNTLLTGYEAGSIRIICQLKSCIALNYRCTFKVRYVIETAECSGILEHKSRIDMVQFSKLSHF